MTKDTAIDMTTLPHITEDSPKPELGDNHKTAIQSENTSTLLRVLSEYVASRVAVEQKPAKR
jgi:hypothetical protein